MILKCGSIYENYVLIWCFVTVGAATIYSIYALHRVLTKTKFKWVALLIFLGIF